MIKQAVIDKIIYFFPGIKIAYKDQSILMKILSFIFYFSKGFKNEYTTMIGNTIYFPSKTYVNHHPISALIAVLHDVVHINDKLTKLMPTILYMFPQVLSLLFLPLLFISLKLALIFLIFLFPFPAYFRMIIEKRAYIASLYVMYRLNIKSSFHINLEQHSKYFVKQFKTSAYYWVWPFNSIDKEFKNAVDLIKNNKRPYEDPIFDILDQIIAIS